jgi:2',3'-cyclic-nucleotide 2'-phosphodiesterase (5'-nucleotidase family)
VGGLARRASVIKSARAQEEHVLVVDAGDSLLTLQRIGDREQGQLLAKAYGQMGYDAVALGGMDFRMGLDVLRGQIEAASYPVLSANTVDPQTGQPFGEGYTIVERAGHRIALIGLTDAKTVAEVTQGNVQVFEPVQTLIDVVAQIRDEVDVVIVLSHLGMLFDIRLGQMVPEIDLIVSGRDKEVYHPPLDREGVVIVSAGSRGEYVGRVNLRFDANGKVTFHDGSVQALTDEVPDDPEMRSWMAQNGLLAATALKSGSGGQFAP